MKTTTVFLVSALVIAVFSDISIAQTASQSKGVHFGNQVPSKQEFIDALKPKPKYKLRGIRVNNQEPAEPASLALSVNFAHDSFELSDHAQTQLNPLGEALNSEELAPYSFVIDGHTDASGTEDYNMTLSQKRALAVGNYLYNNYAVDVARLELSGKGEAELYDATSPTSAINRRVQVTTVVSQ